MSKSGKVLRVICATVLAFGIAMPSTAAFATPGEPVVLEGSEVGGGGGSPASEPALAEDTQPDAGLDGASPDAADSPLATEADNPSTSSPPPEISTQAPQESQTPQDDLNTQDGSAALVAPLAIEEKPQENIVAPMALSLTGDGSKETPYLITNADDLMAFATDSAATPANTNGKYYKLTADIDLIGKTWPLIQNFAGHLDGDFHTVSNFSLTSSAASTPKGFISSATSGSIENLIVKGSIVSTGSGAVGGIIGSTSGAFTISNVGSEVDITVSSASSTSNYNGGILGVCAGGSIKDSYYNATLRSSQDNYYSLGGIAGRGSNVQFENCLNFGTISYTGTTVATGYYCAIGGISGFYASSLINCVNVGTISTTVANGNTNIGALIGYYTDTTIPSYQDAYYLTGSYTSAVGTASSIIDPVGVTSLSQGVIQSYDFAATDKYFENPFLSYVEGDWRNWPALPFSLAMRGAPVITSTSTDKGYVRDTSSAAVTSLNVTAAPLAGHAFSAGTPSYQWYASTERSQSTNSGAATPIESADSATYVPPVITNGATYYFCKVTNTWTDGREQSASALSTPVLISVFDEGTEAGMVNIKSQPLDTDTEFLEETELSVAAEVSGTEGTLDYQWYRNAGEIEEGASDEEIMAGATAIHRATDSTYEIPTIMPGEVYYFCKITNTVEFTEKATATTDVVKVKVAPTYSIGTAQELMGLAADVSAHRNYFAGITVYLTDDIDLEGVCGPDVGPDGTSVNFNSVTGNFLGNFDGGYHTISNYYVSSSEINPGVDWGVGGLFLYIAGGGILENVFIKGTIVVNSSDVGALIANATSVTVRNVGVDVYIVNSYTSGTVYTGGVVGRLSGSSEVINCYNHGRITSNASSTEYTGGIVGYFNSTGRVIDCYNSGTITGGSYASASVGGIVGMIPNGQIADSYNSGTVTKTGSSSYVGPISGYSSQSGAGTKCYYLDSTAVATTVIQPNATAVSGAVLGDESFPAQLSEAFRYNEGGFPQLFFEQGAGWPIITTQPVSARYARGLTADPLTVEATLPALNHVGWQGFLSYQWYTNTTKSPDGAISVGNPNETSFTPDTTDTGISYYYCVVTNSYDGSETETILTDIVTVAVVDGTPVAPVITQEPQETFVLEGTMPDKAFAITAEPGSGGSTPSGEPTYQWYSNKTGMIPATPLLAENEKLDGATKASYTPFVQGMAGEKIWYYCIVTTSFGDIPSERATISKSASLTFTPTRIIYTPADLLDFAREVNGTKVVEGQTLPTNTFAGKTIELATDLDLSTYSPTAGNWTPIAWSSSTSCYFEGVFNGNGHAIKNLSYSAVNAETLPVYVGLFGRIRGATIKNLKLNGDITFTNLTTGNRPIGFIAAIDSGTNANPSTISNVEVDGSITITRESSTSSTALSGGIALGLGARNAYTRINKVVTKGSIDIAGNYQVSTNGVAGVAAGTTTASTSFVECGNEANITIDSTSTQTVSYVSGVGSYASSFTRCYNKGDILVASLATGTSYIGGISAGPTTGTAAFSQCYNTGSVTGPYYVSGICYGTATTTISGCYNTGAVASTRSGTNAAAINNAAVSASSANNFYLEGSVQSTQPTAARGESKDAPELKGSEVLAALNISAASYIPGTDSPRLIWELGVGAPVITDESLDEERLMADTETDTAKLSVTAEFPAGENTPGNGGTPSYQWYESRSALNSYGQKITGADEDNYEWKATSSDTPGYHYFYCVVTNTWDGGAHSASTASNTFRVSLVTTDDVWEPVFAAQPEDTWYIRSDENVASPTLAVGVIVPENDNGGAVGTIDYQWYSNTTASYEHAAKLWGETKSTYAPPITKLGTTYYYCEAINTYQESNIVTAASDIVKAVVWDYAGAAPIISAQPEPAQYIQGAIDAAPLSVTAEKPAGITGSDGELGYQWYYKTMDGKPDLITDTLVQGATDSTWIPDTTLGLDTYYYYCVVTNTINIAHPEDTHYPDAISDTALVAIVSEIPATRPVIDSSALTDTSYTQKVAPAPLSVTVGFGSATEGFDSPEPVLSYQWYKNTTGTVPAGDALTGDKPSPGDVRIEGIITNTYDPPATSTLGTTYYYCLVTNTFEQVKKNAAASELVAITIEPLLRIQTVQDFKNFADSVAANEAYYYDDYTVVLEADLDLEDSALTDPWTPIGTNNKPFTGTFDGKGHTIAGLHSTATGTGGLFDYVVRATIENLIVRGFIESSATYISGVVASIATNGKTAPTTIRNVGSEVDIHSTSTGNPTIGGIIASASGASIANGVYIEGCYYKGNSEDTTRSYDIFTDSSRVNTSPCVGGIIGSAGRYTFIKNCYNAGTIRGCGATGGIAGYMSYNYPDNSIANTYNSGTVIYAAGGETDYSNLGGIAGYNGNQSYTGQFSDVYYLDTSCFKATYYDYDSYREGFAAVIHSITGADLGLPTQISALNGTQGSAGPWREGNLYPVLAWEKDAYGTPDITTQPVASSYVEQGTTPVALSAEANSPATTKAAKDGTLSWQWYSNSTSNTEGGTPVGTATANPVFVPPTTELGFVWYYCVATNTWEAAGSEAAGSASITSKPSYFRVITATLAAMPEITVEPLENQIIAQFAEMLPLAVVATVEGKAGAGTLAYQWYESTTNDFKTAKTILGADEASYIPSSAIVGTTYYFCEIINTYEEIKETPAITRAARVQIAGIPIVTPADLLEVAQNVNNGTNLYAGITLELIADINLASDPKTENWTPIGTSASTSFQGSFYGNGHTISGLFIEAAPTVSSSLGLFGNIRGATLKDFVVKGSISVQATVTSYVGGVVALANYSNLVTPNVGCTILNVGSEVDIDTGPSTTSYVGGVFGYSNGASAAYNTIRSCYNRGDLRDTASSAAGIAGLAAYTNFSGCYNTGDITINVSPTATAALYVGGIVAYRSSGGTVDACYNAGDITIIEPQESTGTTTRSVGAVVGRNDIQGITNSFYLDETAADDGIAGTDPRNSEDMQDVAFLEDIDPDGDYYKRGATYPVLAWEPGIPLETTEFAITGIDEESYPYTGRATEPNFIVTDGEETLDRDIDYTVSYTPDNISAGEVTLTVTGRNVYSGELSEIFTINKAPLTISVASLTKTYGESDPVFTGTAPGLQGGDAIVSLATTRAAGENRGSYTVTATGVEIAGNGRNATANYDISFVPGTLTINALNLATAGFAITGINAAGYTYNGSAITPAVSVVKGSTTLNPATDYTLSYSSNTALGTATVTVTGKGNYTGQLSASFTINSPEKVAWPRLDGGKENGNRYDTMQAIVGEGWSTSNYVIVASGMNFPDALAASSLAGIYGAPVILTETGGLTFQAEQTIRSLGATRALIIGGEAAVSPETFAALEGVVGPGKVSRISGENRIETALDIYEKGKTPEGGNSSWGDTAIIANGFNFADALSISPYAHVTRSPIFLSTPGTDAGSGLDAATLTAITQGGFKKVIITGGTAAVPALVEDQLAQTGVTIERWSGENRYETSVDIVKNSLANSNGALTLNNLVCATGDNYPDALAGGAFAGHTGTVLLLVHSTQTGGLSGLDLISERKDEIGKGYVLGGAAAIPQELLTLLQEGAKSS